MNSDIRREVEVCPQIAPLVADELLTLKDAILAEEHSSSPGSDKMGLQLILIKGVLPGFENLDEGHDFRLYCATECSSGTEFQEVLDNIAKMKSASFLDQCQETFSGVLIRAKSISASSTTDSFEEKEYAPSRRDCLALTSISVVFGLLAVSIGCFFCSVPDKWGTLPHPLQSPYHDSTKLLLIMFILWRSPDPRSSEEDIQILVSYVSVNEELNMAITTGGEYYGRHCTYHHRPGRGNRQNHTHISRGEQEEKEERTSLTHSINFSRVRLN